MASALFVLLLFSAASSPDASARSLVAPAKVCKNVSGNAANGKAIGSMLCFTNYARAKKGLKKYRPVGKLKFAARKKAADILRCDEFSHEACGRDFTYWMERSGYNGCRLGENIAFGTGGLGSSRKIFQAWMKSPGHRRNILNRDFRDIGIGLRTGHMEGISGAHIWVQNFGSSC